MTVDTFEQECFVCPICLDSNDDLTGHLIPCNHQFHKECIRQWHVYSDDLKCPICRVESTELQISYELGKIQKPVIVNLIKGFGVKPLLDSRDEGSVSGIIESFDRVLHLDGLISSQGISTERACSICGEECCDADRSCDRCALSFHEGCLRSLACEVGDPLSWQQCLECRIPVCEVISRASQPIADIRITTQITCPMGIETTERSTEEALRKLREAKGKIQQHVRCALNPYYKSSKNGVKIDKRDFTEINKTVSRRLYKISRYIYQEGSINYDVEAKKAVHIELCKLGYSCV